MMKNIKLLDCTLRDGGSVNNGMFGYSRILSIIQFLNDANVEIIETGFIDNNVLANKNSSINPNVDFFNKITRQIKNKKSKVVAMLDFSKYNRNNFNITKREDLDGIRIMFKKNQMPEVFDFCYKLKDLGYSIALNPVSITTYKKDELITLLKQANILSPDAVYMIDTYGLLDKEETIDYFNLFKKYLDENIQIGYHSHNNRQLSFSNSIELVNNSENRNIVIDTALLGMGKRAGNTPTELMANHLNSHCKKEYDLNKIMQIINSDIVPLKEKYEWGYSLIHYIAAINKCHSDYVTYFYNVKKLSIEEINNVLPKIEEEKKFSFDSKYADILADNCKKVLK